MRSEPSSTGIGPAPFVIEFVGVPGSGKTSLADQLVERLETAGFDVATITSLARRRAAATTVGKIILTIAPRRLHSTLLWWVFYALGTGSGIGLCQRDPRLARLVVTSQRHRPLSVRTRAHILYWFFQLAGRYRVLVDSSIGAQVLVIDDGFVHRAVHLHASHLRGPDTRSVVSYLELIPVPDLLVHVDTDTQICLERVVARGVWAHSRHLAQTELSEYLGAAAAVVGTASEAMRTRGATVVEVSGTVDPAVTSGELCARVLTDLPQPEEGSMPSGIGPILRLPRKSRITSSVAARMHDPAIDEETLGAVLEEFGIPRIGTARNIWLSRRNRNVVVATGSGRKVVKLYRPQWSAETVECAHSILRRLEDVRFPAPRLVRRPLGDDQVTTGHGVAAVFDFIDGANLSLHYLLRPDRLELTIEAGSTLAALHRSLQGFTPSGQHHLGFAGAGGPRHRDLRWFAETIAELIDRSGELTEPGVAARVGSLVARSDQTYSSLEQLDRKLSDTSLPRLVIHGDYGLHNLLFRRRLPAVPVDFELARLDWRVFDLISALGKHRFKGGAYDFESMKAFQRGYASRFPLTEEERALFPDAWRLYKLQAAVQYWLSYFMTDGPARKLDSALDALDQAEWVTGNETDLTALVSVGAFR